MIVDMTPKCNKTLTHAQPLRLMNGHAPDRFGRYDAQPELCNPFLHVENPAEQPFDQAVIFLAETRKFYFYHYSPAQGLYWLQQCGSRELTKKDALSRRGRYYLSDSVYQAILEAYQKWEKLGKPQENISFIW